MTEAQAIEAISAQFAAQWPTASSNVPFALANEAMPSADTFAVLSFTPTVAGQATLGAPGNRRWRRDGFVFVKIWTPIDQGENAAATLRDAARAVLEGQTLGGSPGIEPVVIGAGASIDIGTDDRWDMCAVRLPYYFFETR